jgi:hypothetical protein
MPVLDVADAERGMDLYREVTRRVASAQGVPLVDLARVAPDQRLSGWRKP